jgi:hypothetical protein
MHFEFRKLYKFTLSEIIVNLLENFTSTITARRALHLTTFYIVSLLLVSFCKTRTDSAARQFLPKVSLFVNSSPTITSSYCIPSTTRP